MLFPFMLGALALMLYLPLLGAPRCFSLFGKCVDNVLRAKNEDSRSFSKVDEVLVYPYYLGVVAFRFLTCREGPLDPSS